MPRVRPQALHCLVAQRLCATLVRDDTYYVSLCYILYHYVCPRIVVKNLVVQNLVVQNLVVKNLVVQKLVVKNLVVKNLVVKTLVVRKLVVNTGVWPLLVATACCNRPRLQKAASSYELTRGSAH